MSMFKVYGIAYEETERIVNSADFKETGALISYTEGRLLVFNLREDERVEYYFEGFEIAYVETSKAIYYGNLFAPAVMGPLRLKFYVEGRDRRIGIGAAFDLGEKELLLDYCLTVKEYGDEGDVVDAFYKLLLELRKMFSSYNKVRIFGVEDSNKMQGMMLYLEAHQDEKSYYLSGVCEDLPVFEMSPIDTSIVSGVVGNLPFEIWGADFEFKFGGNIKLICKSFEAEAVENVVLLYTLFQHFGSDGGILLKSDRYNLDIPLQAEQILLLISSEEYTLEMDEIDYVLEKGRPMLVVDGENLLIADNGTDYERLGNPFIVNIEGTELGNYRCSRVTRY